MRVAPPAMEDERTGVKKGGQANKSHAIYTLPFCKTRGDFKQNQDHKFERKLTTLGDNSQPLCLQTAKVLIPYTVSGRQCRLVL